MRGRRLPLPVILWPLVAVPSSPSSCTIHSKRLIYNVFVDVLTSVATYCLGRDTVYRYPMALTKTTVSSFACTVRLVLLHPPVIRSVGLSVKQIEKFMRFPRSFRFPSSVYFLMRFAYRFVFVFFVDVLMRFANVPSASFRLPFFFVRPSFSGCRSTGNYHPMVYVNEFWLQKKHLIAINETVKTVPLELTISPMGIWKFQVKKEIALFQGVCFEVC